MWRRANVYEALYDSPGQLAGSVIMALDVGLFHMQNNPDIYTALNPANGWGNYEGALTFLAGLLEACRRHPKATLWVSR